MEELNYKELQEKGVFDVPYRAFQFMQEQQAIIDDLKAQLECCRKENAVLLGRVGELEKNEFLLARVKTILGCEKKTNLLESIIVRDLRKVLRGEHEGN